MVATSTLRRRLISFPVLAIATAALWGFAPAWLLAGAAWDLTRGQKLAVTRTLLMLMFYTAVDWVGIAAALGTRATCATLGDPNGRRSLAWNRHIKKAWNQTLASVGFRLFNARLDVQGADCADGSPFIVFLRHAGIADVLIAPLVFELGRPTHLRYAVKRELLWDPAFDLVGSQVRTTFVDRDSRDGPAERARIASMLNDLEPDEGVLIYPEGTRFSTSKAETIRARLRASGDAAALDHASSLQRVLPAKLGGPLSLLQRNPGVDVVFCAHTGLDRAYSVGDMTRGALVGLVVRVRLWRVPFAEIPTDPERQVAWMRDQWQRMDREVQALEQAPPTHGLAGP